MSADGLERAVGPHVTALFNELDRVQREASRALADGDMERWLENAGRGAEIFEEIAKRAGWRDGPSEPPPGWAGHKGGTDEA